MVVDIPAGFARSLCEENIRYLRFYAVACGAGNRDRAGFVIGKIGSPNFKGIGWIAARENYIPLLTNNPKNLNCKTVFILLIAIRQVL